MSILAIVTLVLAGCTGETDPDATDAAGSAEQAQAAKETSESLQADAGADAADQAVAQDLQVLGTRQTADAGIALEVDLNSVSVSGEVMTVLFTARNMGTERWQIAGFFDDGLLTAPLDADGTRATVSDLTAGSSTDGVAVIDTTNALMHRAAYDTAGTCACNVDLSNHFVGAGQSIVLTTAFAAPPKDVETVTVQIPGAGSFDAVPVTR
ncbi:hypothetical protein [Pengzhenrongella frigida]|uniref:hypothetical protein n=1 Tax=Pengzhenrongella frigida TaxID=1259133 RepID=UPI0013EDADF3|nr:hypothetical protein [Cellulomonas sp. HLT2-17]